MPGDLALFAWLAQIVHCDFRIRWLLVFRVGVGRRWRLRVYALVAGLEVEGLGIVVGIGVIGIVLAIMVGVGIVEDFRAVQVVFVLWVIMFVNVVVAVLFAKVAEVLIVIHNDPHAGRPDPACRLRGFFRRAVRMLVSTQCSRARWHWSSTATSFRVRGSPLEGKRLEVERKENAEEVPRQDYGLIATQKNVETKMEWGEVG